MPDKRQEVQIKNDSIIKRKNIMRKTLFILLLAFACTYTNAQEKGINFITNQSLDAILTQARAQHKTIFIDCSTSWCVPCRWMEQNVFTDSQVGDMFNTNFINVKIDMEKGEGPAIQKKYRIQSFPTYLFLDGKGEVLHRSGSKMTKEEFLTLGKTGLNPNLTIGTLTAKYEAGERSIPFLLNYYSTIIHSDRAKSNEIATFIISNCSEKELSSAIGYKIIATLYPVDNSNRLANFFLSNIEKYKSLANEKELYDLKITLLSRRVYAAIYAKDKEAYEKALTPIKADTNPEVQKKVIMMECLFGLNTMDIKYYLTASNKAMNTLFNNDPSNLAYLSRQVLMQFKTIDANSTPFYQQAYQLAKKGRDLAPETYSNQVTFARVCIAMHNKQEGLVAAQKARELANQSTTKIQHIAQTILEQAQKL